MYTFIYIYLHKYSIFKKNILYKATYALLS